MRAVIQRVSEAVVHVDGEEISSIGKGLLVLLGTEEADSDEDTEWLSRKIVGMRIFSDAEGRMNLSLNDLTADALIVSQFTLFASTKKGNRPSFIKAAPAHIAEKTYEKFLQTMETKAKGKVAAGKFGAMMEVSLCNDGPVTIVIDSKNKE